MGVIAFDPERRREMLTALVLPRSRATGSLTLTRQTTFHAENGSAEEANPLNNLMKKPTTKEGITASELSDLMDWFEKEKKSVITRILKRPKENNKALQEK